MAYTRKDIEISTGSPNLHAVGVYGTKSAIDFTTSKSGIRIKVDDNLDMTTCTIMYWAYTHRITDFQASIGWNAYGVDNANPAIRMIFLHSDFRWTYGPSDASVLVYNFIPERQWNHYCIIRNKTEFKLYINGSLVVTNTISEGPWPIDTVKTGYIDIGCPGYYSQGEHYQGILDDLMISRSVVVNSDFDPMTPAKLLYPGVDWLIDMSPLNEGYIKNILKVY